MGSESLFLKRYERKYLFDEETYKRFLDMTGDTFVPDAYPKSHICNIYFDTPDFLLIRRSIEKPDFKEKLRLRTYEPPTDTSMAFCEIKRKVDKVVYKRRIQSDYKSAYDYLVNREKTVPDTQIAREIDYMFRFYEGLAPAMKVSYVRESYAAKNPASPLRVTFDRQILWDTANFEQRGGVSGRELLPEGLVLMELKIGDAVPLEILEIFDELSIRKSSFSKYGNAYKQMTGHEIPLEILVSGLGGNKR